MRYKILKNMTTEGLEIKVQRYMNSGWELSGGIIVSSMEDPSYRPPTTEHPGVAFPGPIIYRAYAQAMVKT